ncbi:3-hydroxyacyl-CoA dehydrogenase NAD-binding domain-containing protein [Shimia abyssi]|uniref:3-hydroxyacyl-CoA dehydrogenase n=1 Tax=Shimia abyssi TaxID=1662395 RepID=A0A2P8FJ29_9RHOB|nr:3-hydroxyacyl-CoA dehydrogenase NAD-binding domain-containing protein [Shimia abyssi]PSL21732.1 3-hydroxyacyl-CoA dehydrogenase [Shimia abyssi]
MSNTVGFQTEQGIAVLTMGQAPTNALTAEMRGNLLSCFSRALADSDIHAIVVTGSGKVFSTGLNLTEIEAEATAPSITELFRTIENSPKPVIAVLNGGALGPGFGLALACHYRVARAGVHVGFPEVTIGLLPEGGTIQRVARIGGAQTAMDLVATGRRIAVEADVLQPFVDQATTSDEIDVARKFASHLVKAGKTPRRSCDRIEGVVDGTAFQGALGGWRSKVGVRAEVAPREILRCVEAAGLLPFDVGIEFEAAALDVLRASDQSKALRHLFKAERRAVRFPELATGKVKRLDHVGIIGADVRGCGMALMCLLSGRKVTLVDKDTAHAEQAAARVASMLRRAISQAQLPDDRLAPVLANLTTSSELAALAHADLVIEMAGQDAIVRADLFKALADHLSPDAIMTTASSLADITHLASGTQHPERVAGIHIPLPIRTTRLAEIAVHRGCDGDVVASLHGFVQSLGKVPVRSGAVPGLIGDRVAAACLYAADELVVSGITPDRVDRAMRMWGMARGPFQAADAIGLDRIKVRQQMFGYTAGQPVLDKLLQLGRLGRKARAGFFEYAPDQANNMAPPELQNVLAEIWQSNDIQPRELDAATIQTRCLAAMANEGARLLKLGVAQRPSDIDVVMTLGHGFPNWRGGPMQAADAFGLLALRGKLRDYTEHDAEFWAPETHFDLLIKNGAGFASLND